MLTKAHDSWYRKENLLQQLNIWDKKKRNQKKQSFWIQVYGILMGKAGLETATNGGANATNLVAFVTKSFRAVAKLWLDFPQTSIPEFVRFFRFGNWKFISILIRKYAVSNRGAQSLPPDFSRSLGTYPPTPSLDPTATLTHPQPETQPRGGEGRPQKPGLFWNFPREAWLGISSMERWCE